MGTAITIGSLEYGHFLLKNKFHAYHLYSEKSLLQEKCRFWAHFTKVSQLSASPSCFNNEETLSQCWFWNKIGETCRDLYSLSVVFWAIRGSVVAQKALINTSENVASLTFVPWSMPNPAACKTKICQSFYICKLQLWPFEGRWNTLRKVQIFSKNATKKCLSGPKVMPTPKEMTHTRTAAAKRGSTDHFQRAAK